MFYFSWLLYRFASSGSEELEDRSCLQLCLVRVPAKKMIRHSFSFGESAERIICYYRNYVYLLFHLIWRGLSEMLFALWCQLGNLLLLLWWIQLMLGEAERNLAVRMMTNKLQLYFRSGIFLNDAQPYFDRFNFCTFTGWHRWRKFGFWKERKYRWNSKRGSRRLQRGSSQWKKHLTSHERLFRRGWEEQGSDSSTISIVWLGVTEESS